MTPYFTGAEVAQRNLRAKKYLKTKEEQAGNNTTFVLYSIVFFLVFFGLATMVFHYAP